MVRDPVCGMEVKNDIFMTTWDGRLYRFCSKGCQQRFEESAGKFVERRDYDLIIVGGGPAGLTAAVYASMHHLDSFLITKDIGGQAIDSTKVKNYMGFDFITGPELISRFQEQLLNSNFVDHKIGEIIGIEKKDDRFSLLASGGETYRALSVILATGMQRRTLGVPGEERLQRRGIFYSHVQDTGILQGVPVAVVGGGNTGAQIALELASIASKVTLVTFEDLTADAHLKKEIQQSNINLFTEHTIVSIDGDEKVEGLTIRSSQDGTAFSLDVGAVFIGIGLSPNSAVVSRLLDRNERMEVEINKDCSTSIPGIFSAGDVTENLDKRIVIASGEGAKAALTANRYLKAFKKRDVG